MEWIQVFPSSAAARERLKENKPQLLIVHGRRICLVLSNGTFCAVQDSCTHNGASLSKGTVNFMGEIVCPLHGYQFSLKTGREARENSADLRTYPIKEDETGFYIGV